MADPGMETDAELDFHEEIMRNDQMITVEVIISISYPCIFSLAALVYCC